jgi:hypothetical protein
MNKREELKMLENFWNDMDIEERVTFCNAKCGWAKRTASKIAKTNWNELPIAAKNVVSYMVNGTKPFK